MDIRDYLYTRGIFPCIPGHPYFQKETLVALETSPFFSYSPYFHANKIRERKEESLELLKGHRKMRFIRDAS
jgi:hypothetical protein